MPMMTICTIRHTLAYRGVDRQAPAKRFDHAPFGAGRVVSAHASHEPDFAVT